MTSPAIGPDMFITLAYVLFDERGEAVDRATASDPLTYVHGYAQIVPGLEVRLVGMHAGEKAAFALEADEAFGARDDEGVFEVDRTDFPESGKVATGDEFVAEGPDGEPISMRVVEVLPEALVVDTNHPLAGQRVRFEVQIDDVRSATEEEIASAELELEERIEGDGGCGHDHDHDHDHEHAHPHTEGVRLIQLAKR